MKIIIEHAEKSPKVIKAIFDALWSQENEARNNLVSVAQEKILDLKKGETLSLQTKPFEITIEG